MNLFRLFGLAGLAAIVSGPALATTYDAVADFSASNNPNGVWSYRQGDGTVLGSETATSPGAGSLPYWQNGSSYPTGSYVVDNATSIGYSSGTVSYRADELTLDGQSIGAIVRFTAAVAGKYSVTGLFQANDTSPAAHPVSVSEDGTTVLFTGTSPSSYSGAALTFAFDTTLAAGDYLDFISAGFNNGTYGSTGLQARLVTDAPGSAVPEPASIVLLAAGLLGLGAVGRKAS